MQIAVHAACINGSVISVCALLEYDLVTRRIKTVLSTIIERHFLMKHSPTAIMKSIADMKSDPDMTLSSPDVGLCNLAGCAVVARVLLVVASD